LRHGGRTRKGLTFLAFRTSLLLALSPLRG